MAGFRKLYVLCTRIALILVLGLSSCRAPRELPKIAAKSISTTKLLKKVEQNSFDYNWFSIKRINCQFSGNQSKANFKINLKAHKDEQILVSIHKLQIPVGRVLLTPDSVKYVNYIDRNYFIDDYSYLSNYLNIDLDFETIQSIISNHAFSYRNDGKNKDFKTFESTIEEGFYVLQSEKEAKMQNWEEKGKTGKMERRLKKKDRNALILQKMYFDPVNFALTKLIISDKKNQRLMTLVFSDFIRFKNKEYPGALNMNFTSLSNEVNLKVKMSGFSSDKINNFSLKIPEKYEQIKVN